jgi:hypothetical protein
VRYAPDLLDRPTDKIVFWASACWPDAMFLMTFEFALLFDDVKQFMRGALLALRALGMQSIGPMGALVIGAGVFQSRSPVH